MDILPISDDVYCEVLVKYLPLIDIHQPSVLKDEFFERFPSEESFQYSLHADDVEKFQLFPEKQQHESMRSSVRQKKYNISKFLLSIGRYTRYIEWTFEDCSILRDFSYRDVSVFGEIAGASSLLILETQYQDKEYILRDVFVADFLDKHNIENAYLYRARKSVVEWLKRHCDEIKNFSEIRIYAMIRSFLRKNPSRIQENSLNWYLRNNSWIIEILGL